MPAVYLTERDRYRIADVLSEKIQKRSYDVQIAIDNAFETHNLHLSLLNTAPLAIKKAYYMNQQWLYTWVEQATYFYLRIWDAENLTWQSRYIHPGKKCYIPKAVNAIQTLYLSPDHPAYEDMSNLFTELDLLRTLQLFAANMPQRDWCRNIRTFSQLRHCLPSLIPYLPDHFVRNAQQLLPKKPKLYDFDIPKEDAIKLTQIRMLIQ